MKVENSNGICWITIPVAAGEVILRVAPPVQGFVKEPSITVCKADTALTMEEATQVAEAFTYAVGIAEQMKTKQFTDRVVKQTLEA